MKTVNYKKFGLQAGDIVLDLGCGEGRHVISAYLEGDVHAVGVDLSHQDLKTTAERFEPFAQEQEDKAFGLSVANALQLPFADNTFDKVICSEVLEHIPDWEGALDEIRRVLKPGGNFCASVPRAWPEKVCWHFSDEYHAMEGGHLRIFDEGEFRCAIELRDFHFYAKHWAHALHSPFWWLKCIFWKTQESNRLIKLYHRFLVWDLMDKPWLTRTLERCLNPLLGKSVVLYFRKGV
ncbi:methyltransferase family protein [Sinobacterium caligoides]|uniref:Methyltransferase family protein n=1 Tax=Sinobacterium caligoides TaxID=933926 RepID=A0A3N2DGA0_9GAMM|nr:class I SAM-dependent methyltransferase [Sinobacterium caligoides]ROR98823.1 methyltransferase family protein [Sinobacterium caligoides]